MSAPDSSSGTASGATEANIAPSNGGMSKAKLCNFIEILDYLRTCYSAMSDECAEDDDLWDCYAQNCEEHAEDILNRDLQGSEADDAYDFYVYEAEEAYKYAANDDDEDHVTNKAARNGGVIGDGDEPGFKTLVFALIHEMIVELEVEGDGDEDAEEVLQNAERLLARFEMSL